MIVNPRLIAAPQSIPQATASFSGLAVNSEIFICMPWVSATPVIPYRAVSRDGISWDVASVSFPATVWSTFGNGVFCSIDQISTCATSPDGINWTSGNFPTGGQWRAITYGNGIFVAVGMAGTGNRVMTSPNGLNWTVGVSAANNNWQSVCYGGGQFVAVANTGAGNRVMTSPDGFSWTIRASASDLSWVRVAYGNGIYVALAASNMMANILIMTSPDGAQWTLQQTPFGTEFSPSWNALAFSDGQFIAATNNRLMMSEDGIVWRAIRTTANISWTDMCYGLGRTVLSAQGNTGVITPAAVPTLVT